MYPTRTGPIPVLVALFALLSGAAQSQTLAIATNPVGSIFNQLGNAIAKVLSEKAGIQARVQPYAGASAIVPLVERNEVELAIINDNDIEEGYRGENTFQGRPHPGLRYVIALYIPPFGYLVPNNAEIRTGADLKGKRVAVDYIAQTSFHVANQALLANVGLTQADVVGVPVQSSARAVQLLSQGQLLAAIGGPGAGFIAQAHAELRSRGGVRFISIDTSEAAWARTRKIMNVRMIAIDPAPHLPGIVERTTLIGYYVNLVSNQTFPDDLAHRIVKTVAENKPDLVASMPALASFDPGKMAFRTDVPFHPGAIRFYRETNQWPPKD